MESPSFAPVQKSITYTTLDLIAQQKYLILYPNAERSHGMEQR